MARLDQGFAHTPRVGHTWLYDETLAPRSVPTFWLRTLPGSDQAMRFVYRRGSEALPFSLTALPSAALGLPNPNSGSIYGLDVPYRCNINEGISTDNE